MPQHVELTGGQRAVDGVPGGQRQVAVDHAAAGQDAAHGVGELVRGRVLEQEPAHLGVQRAPERARPAQAGEDEGPAARQLFVQLTGRGEAVLAGQVDVDDGHLCLLGARRGQDLEPGGDLGDHVDVGLQPQQRHQRSPDDVHVFGHQHFDHEAPPPSRTPIPRATVKHLPRIPGCPIGGRREKPRAARANAPGTRPVAIGRLPEVRKAECLQTEGRKLTRSPLSGRPARTRRSRPPGPRRPG